LGIDAAPIGIIEAEGSVWVALHHANAVLRIDPDTFEVMARIATGPVSGPAWFTVGDGSTWVTNQNGAGVSRINPDTNKVNAQVGADPPCGPPAFFEESVWIDACDTPALVRYDASTNARAETIDTPEPMAPIVAGDALWGVGGRGIYRLDTTARSMKLESPCCGAADPPATRDGEMWTGQGPTSMMVLSTPSLRRIARVPVGSAMTMAFDASRAWVLSGGGSAKLTSVDLSTYEPIESYEFGLQLASIAVVGDRLWVTDFGLSQVFVITPE
jgi:streptogramin lyase